MIGVHHLRTEDFTYQAPYPRGRLPDSLVIWALETKNRQLRRRAFKFLTLVAMTEPRIVVDNPEIMEELEFYARS